MGWGVDPETVNKRGGAYKIPAAWGLKIYTPTPLPWKMPFGQKWGRGGGGVYNFSLENKRKVGGARPHWYRAKLCTPPPPTPENALLGVWVGMLGACAMTTNFLDNKFAFLNFIVMAFPTKKNSVFGQSSSLPPVLPSQKRKFLF